MSSLQSLDIAKRSATTTNPPQARKTIEVAKLIDVSSCIGCKACQVACMQWNDLRDEVGETHGTYDNPRDLTPQSWTVMRYSEVEVEKDKLEWLIRKDGCMHCDAWLHDRNVACTARRHRFLCPAWPHRCLPACTLFVRRRSRRRRRRGPT